MTSCCGWCRRQELGSEPAPLVTVAAERGAAAASSDPASAANPPEFVGDPSEGSPTALASADPVLQFILDVWPILPADVRLRVLAVIREGREAR